MSAERRSDEHLHFQVGSQPRIAGVFQRSRRPEFAGEFRPWHAVGVVKPDAAPPNNLSRDVIEKSIADTGYQLWKMKSEK